MWKILYTYIGNIKKVDLGGGGGTIYMYVVFISRHHICDLGVRGSGLRANAFWKIINVELGV